MTDPYRNMAASILFLALEDAGLLDVGRDGKPRAHARFVPRTERENALAWIFQDKNPFYSYSFRGCCDLMCIAYVDLRERLRNRLNAAQREILANLATRG